MDSHKESDDALVANLAKSIKPISFTTYMFRIKSIRLLAPPDKNIAWIMKHPSLMIQSMRQKFHQDNATLPNKLTPINKLFSSNPHMMLKYPQHYQKWLIALKEERDKELERYKNNTLTDKQQKNIIDYDIVFQKYNDMVKQIPAIFQDKKTNLEFLLLAILINMRPKRADFGYVQILHKHPTDKNSFNYIVLNKNESQFVLNNHKTSFTYKQIVEDINADLQKIINSSLQFFPRQYLFVDSNDKPYIKNNSYAGFVKRFFRKYFDKNVGVSLWRKIRNYEKLNFDTMSWKELEKEAHLMGHSVMQQFLIYKIKK
jgi:hypothetical protein